MSLQHKHDPTQEIVEAKSPVEPMVTIPMAHPLTQTPLDVGGLEAQPGMIPAPEVVVAHPLSPMAETGQDVVNPSMTSSTDSIPSLVASHRPDSESEGSHGWYLSSTDLDNLRHFIQDYTVRALIPYIERVVGYLNESITNKKGVSRSLLSATKRWFVTNKPALGVAPSGTSSYTPDSTEIQTRKLGDLYFMFGNYNLAFQAYHAAKRDFNADSAWQYYAGALEMAALSAFMQGTANRKTYDYMEEAIITYLNYCKMPQFATRATLLNHECLKSAKMYGEACRQLTRMTSEDSDLRSALLLEQAALCYLQNTIPHHRKYAFHMVLAAHRFQRAGQRKHSYRAHKLAYKVYATKSWNLAVDHVLHTVGKQAMTLKKLDEASTLFAHLLRPSAWKDAEKQTLFFMDYISAQKALLNQKEIVDLLDVALPVIDQTSIRVLVTSQPPVANPLFVPASNITINCSQQDEAKWTKLEEMVVQYASPKPIAIFKPIRSLFSHEQPGSENPLSIHGEPIEIRFMLENNIKPKIIFEQIHLLWKFTSDDGVTIDNSSMFKSNGKVDGVSFDHVVSSWSIGVLEFNEYEKKAVTMKLTPKQVGQLTITGIAGKLSCPNESGSLSLWGKLKMIKSPDKQHDLNKMLNIQILPPAPVLHVSFSQTPDEVLAGEVIPIMINLTNAGTSPIGDIYVAVESPRWVSVNPEESELPLSVLRNFRDLTNETFSRDKEARKQYCFKLFKDSESVIVAPKETKTTSIWLQAPYKKGRKEIRFLIYYAMASDYPKLKYRLVRHLWTINVHESLNATANCNIGDLETNELGVDLKIKNMNQVHHALMTNIIVSHVSLYCPKYSLDENRIIFLQSPAYQRIFIENDELGLKSDESIVLRLALTESIDTPNKNTVTKFITSQLSEVSIRAMREVKNQLPELGTPGSFLMKHETKYVDVFYKGTSAEEFTNIISKPDTHMTLGVSWKAVVNDGSAIQRNTFGQHFIQLRNLFEVVHCPQRERLQNVSFIHEEFDSIYELKKPKHATQNFDDDDWAPHNVCVAQRCFLDYEVQVTELGGDDVKPGAAKVH